MIAAYMKDLAGQGIRILNQVQGRLYKAILAGDVTGVSKALEYRRPGDTDKLPPYALLLKPILDNQPFDLGSIIDIIKLMGDAGIKPNDEDMVAAAARAPSNIAIQLLEVGGNPNAIWKGEPLLRYVIGRNDVNLALKLIEKGAMVDYTDSRGLSLLMMAVATGSYELSEAIFKGLKDPVETLILIAPNGATAYDMAKQLKHEKIAMLLEFPTAEAIFKVLDRNLQAARPAMMPARSKWY